MTPLESLLSRRQEVSAYRAYRVIHHISRISPILGKWANKILFNHAHGNMRYYDPRLRLHLKAPGVWDLRMEGKKVGITSPLTELVGMIDRPVTIVASGPSARDYPLASLQNGERFVIAVNGAPTFLKEYGITPDLWVIIDHKFCATGHRHFENATGVPLVIETIAGAKWATLNPSDFRSRKITLIERVNIWYALRKFTFQELININKRSGSPWVFPERLDKKLRVGWSFKPELGFFSALTVTYAALQVAVRLGAKDIEIIGMDLAGKARAYEEGDRTQPSYLEDHYADYILPSFQIMSKALADTDIKVRNLSPICALPSCLFSD